MARWASALRKTGCVAIAAAWVLGGPNLGAEPASKKTATSMAALIESANGWIYANGQWVHPDGYKFVNNKIVRTTAKTGKAHPEPPGKLAQQNPAKLAPRTNSAAAPSPKDAQVAAEKAAEIRRKNLTPRPAPQTGSHL